MNRYLTIAFSTALAVSLSSLGCTDDPIDTQTAALQSCYDTGFGLKCMSTPNGLETAAIDANGDGTLDQFVCGDTASDSDSDSTADDSDESSAEEGEVDSQEDGDADSESGSDSNSDSDEDCGESISDGDSLSDSESDLDGDGDGDLGHQRLRLHVAKQLLSYRTMVSALQSADHFCGMRGQQFSAVSAERTPARAKTTA